MVAHISEARYQSQVLSLFVVKILYSALRSTKRLRFHFSILTVGLTVCR